MVYENTARIPRAVHGDEWCPYFTGGLGNKFPQVKKASFLKPRLVGGEFHWFDHKIKEIGPRPLPLAGGELKPGQIRRVGPDYNPGLYAIGWRKQGNGEHTGFEPLRVRSGTSSLVLTPEGLKEFLGAAR